VLYQLSYSGSGANFRETGPPGPVEIAFSVEKWTPITLKAPESPLAVPAASGPGLASMRTPVHGCRAGGFSLLELLMALSILALLVTLAVPSFRALRANAATGAAANELLLALHRARSSALTRGAATVLCLADTAGACLRSGTAQGYRVFPEDAPAVPLERVRLARGLTLAATRPLITYWPWPRAGTTVTFTLCDARTPSAARQVIVSQTGRPRVQRGGATVCR
jgi:type IV fimbrial biogenesis protein FimT